MLNISHNRVDSEKIVPYYQAFREVIDPKYARVLTYWMLGTLLGTIIILFLPWTQNISARGQLTTLRPEQRPQVIVSAISGRIEQWYVGEGDTVLRGDTIVFLSEIKDDYFDPLLVDRAEEQLSSKRSAIGSYREKAIALESQISALRQNQRLKTEQLRNKLQQARFKIQGDSIDLVAAEQQFAIAGLQLQRWDTLYRAGVKSRTDYEDKSYKYQGAQAKLISQRNKLLVSRNELINAQIELNNIQNEYQEKISKAESDKQSALSSVFDSQGAIAKMQNTVSNYEQRVHLRYITAPQDGFINKALKPGIGETVKEGEGIVNIIPLKYDIAAELFIEPVDLPLVKHGENVRLQFDGWPALVFSGWPNTSFGTFGGKVYAIETNISFNGKYRILVAPNPQDAPWPDQLRVGSGVQGFSLLNDVPLWYELWRQLNGFPPDYYEGKEVEKKK